MSAAAPAPSSALARAFDPLAELLLAAGLVLRLCVTDTHAGTGLNLFIESILAAGLTVAAAGAVLSGGIRTGGLRAWAPLWALLALASWATGTAFWADSPRAVWREGFGWVVHAGLAVTVAAWAGTRPEKSAALIRVLFATALLLAFDGWYQATVGIGRLKTRLAADPHTLDFLPAELRDEFLGRVGAHHAYGPFVTPNSYAGFLILLFPAAFGAALDRWREGGRPLAVRWGLAGIALVSALCFTGSKGGAVGAAAAVGVWAIAALWVSRPGWRKAAITAVLTAVVAAAVLQGTRDVLKVSDRTSSMGVRWGYWIGTARVIGEKPLQGVGLDHFLDAYLRLKDPWAGETRKAHNDYLHVAAETGIVGLVLFLIFAKGSLWAAWKRATAGTGAPDPQAGVEGGESSRMRRAPMLGGLAGLCGAHFFGGAFTWSDASPFGWTIVLGAVWALWGWGAGSGRPTDPLGGSAARAGLLAGMAGLLVHALADIHWSIPATQTALALLAGAAVGSARPSTAGMPSTARRMAALGLVAVCAAGTLAAVTAARDWLAAEDLLRRVRDPRAREKNPPTDVGPLLDEAVELAPDLVEARQETAARIHGVCNRWAALVETRPPEQWEFQLSGGPPREVFERCLEPMRSALAAAPRSSALYDQAGELCRTHRDFVRAVLARGKLQEPGVEAWRRLSREIAGAGVDFARRAVHEYPTRAAHRLHLARWLAATGDVSGAAAEYKAALLMDGQAPIPRLRLNAEERDEAAVYWREKGS